MTVEKVGPITRTYFSSHTVMDFEIKPGRTIKVYHEDMQHCWIGISDKGEVVLGPCRCWWFYIDSDQPLPEIYGKPPVQLTIKWNMSPGL